MRADGSWGMSCACGVPEPQSRPEAPPQRPDPVRTARRHATGLPWAPAGRLRGTALVLWLPRLPRADEGPNGRSWKRRAAGRKAWTQLVVAALADPDAVRCFTPAARRRFLQVTLRYDVFLPPGRRPQDRDNLVVALGKPVQDALVDQAVLAGDDPEHVVATPEVRQHVSPLPWGFVVVTVRPAASRVRP